MRQTNPLFSSYVFGHQGPGVALTAAEIPALLGEARGRVEAARGVKFEEVLEILERVADIWADPEHPLYREALGGLPGRIGFSAAMVAEGLAVVSSLCRRETCLARVRGELGDPALLDGWVERPALGHALRAWPRAPVLHISAGNVFVGAVDSLLAGILTKNVNILKLSRVDPVFPALFLESIRQVDSRGLVWPNQALVTWKGGDASVETPLLTAGLTVVFWGGEEALVALRRQADPGTRFIENGPRYSFALVDVEQLRAGMPDDVLRGLALDLCRWDQQACSSPHLVYLLGGERRDGVALMDALRPHLAELAGTLPVGPLDFDERVEIRRVRDLALMGQVEARSVLTAPDEQSWSLIYEDDAAFKISCLNRTLFIKPLPDLARLQQEVGPISRYLQTVGLWVRPAWKAACEELLLGLGAKRLTVLGGMSEGKAGAPHEGAYLLAGLIDWVDRESATQMSARLEAFLERLRPSPYYGPLLERHAIGRGGKFTDLPLLDRDTYYRHSPPISTAILTRPMTDAQVYASGGSTGEPKFTLYGNDEYRRATETLTFIFASAGLTRHDRVANLFLAGNLWTSFNVVGRALENLGCLSLPIGGNTPWDNMLKYLVAFQVDALVGLPSLLVKLAQEAEARGVVLRIQKILYAGEHLRQPTLDYLRERFGCAWARSAGYACVDTGPIGYQCPDLAGSLHHVLDSYQYVEILDPDGGLPVQDSQRGEIVVTNLDRVLMPVVRYRTGDLGRWRDLPGGRCKCGAVGRTFELLGRVDDLLVIGGINLLPQDVAPALAAAGAGPNFQVVAELRGGRDHLVVRLEPGASGMVADAVLRAALAEHSYKLHDALENGWLSVSFEWVEPAAWERNARTGKIRVVLDRRHV